MANTETFSKGDRVRLGNGREGTIVGKRERVGFHGYVVKITKSSDPVQIGQTVGATAQGMTKLSQVYPVTSTTPITPQQNPNIVPITQEVDPTIDENKQEQMNKQEEQLITRQIQFLQQKLNLLREAQQQQPTSGQPGGDQFKELNRVEQDEQEDLKQRQDVDLAQRMMQQNQQQNQQMQQQFQQVTAGRKWVHPERANVRIALNNLELVCDVAATPHQQASGLQAYNKLDPNRGLWFPFTTKRNASFHMGEVRFPIDIIFVDENKINKIVASVKPRQMGCWSSICTDVLEVNGGWCVRNGISIGDEVVTPMAGKRARSEIEKLVNTSWSAPQEARLAEGDTYDRLRSITTAEGEEELDDFEREMLETFPFLRTAQEHRQPDTTDKRQPGDIDKRNPQTRFLHQAPPDESRPEGQDSPNLTMGEEFSPSSNFSPHFKLQRGYDPVVFREEDGPPIRPSAQVVRVKSPSPDTELAGVDVVKLASGSMQLYDKFEPDWNDVEDERGYNKIAVVNDETISGWIDSLGFDPKDEAKLRQIMFTAEYKNLLGDTLVKSGKVSNFELFESDLLLYQ